MSELITKKDLNKMYLRANMQNLTLNYERMQALACLYQITPALKKIYADEPKEERVKAIQRHLEFFNTMPSFAAPIMAMSAAMEASQKNAAGGVVSGLKVALMGPLAGLGDSLIWFTLAPITIIIGCSYAAEGNPLGLVIAFVVFNAINQAIKYFGIHAGYNQGVKLLERIRDEKMLQRFSKMAAIVGLMLVGSLTPLLVELKLALEVAMDEDVISVQEFILDNLFPGLLPLLLTLGIYRLLKKGTNPIIILLIAIVITIVLVALGVL